VDRLASVKFAVTVVIIIAVACIAGTLIPQGTDVAKYVARHPDAAGRSSGSANSGLTHVFYSVWFVGLLGTLSASVAYAVRGGLSPCSAPTASRGTAPSVRC
jgi:cytochrome c biogenesis protein ResB